MADDDWPQPADHLHYNDIRQFGPFSAHELAFALHKGLLSETDVAQVLDEQMNADNKPFETWEVVERLRASEGDDRAALAHDVHKLDPHSSVDDPERRWYFIVAREALERYTEPRDIIKVLDQIWDDFGRPAQFARFTAIGNTISSRQIVDEDVFEMPPPSYSSAATLAIISALRERIIDEL